MTNAQGSFNYEKINETVGVLEGQFADFNQKSKDLVTLITENVCVGGAILCEGTGSMISSWGTSIAAVDGFAEILTEWAAALEGEIQAIQNKSDEIQQNFAKNQLEAEGIVNEEDMYKLGLAVSASTMGSLAAANMAQNPVENVLDGVYNGINNIGSEDK
jgi:hypothetical protein